MVLLYSKNVPLLSERRALQIGSSRVESSQVKANHHSYGIYVELENWDRIYISISK